MKNPLELAEEYCTKTLGFVSKQDRGTYLAGYEAAHARIVDLIKEELEAIQANKNFSTYVVNPDIESVVESLLNKIKEL